MKKDHVFLLCLLILSLSINIYLKIKINDQYEEKYLLKKENTRKEFLNTFQLMQLKKGWECNGKKLYLEQLVKNEDGQVVPLYELISKPTLVLRYSEINCQSCVDSVLLWVNSFIKSVGADNVVILATYKNHRDLQIFKRLHHINIQINNLIENINNVFKIMALPEVVSSAAFMCFKFCR